MVDWGGAHSRWRCHRRGAACIVAPHIVGFMCTAKILQSSPTILLCRLALDSVWEVSAESLE